MGRNGDVTFLLLSLLAVGIFGSCVVAGEVTGWSKERSRGDKSVLAKHCAPGTMDIVNPGCR